MGVNREYKDSVFSLLFSDPDTLRELYGALEGVTLPPDIPITINTLEDAIYKALLNDISFTIGDKLVVLVEHQSTINPNMPLRLLLYIARLYEKITGSDDLYRTSEVSIPRPEFIVLYNGTAPCPDVQTLKLSGAFRDKTAVPALELSIRVYNINAGHNTEMIRKSEKLTGYSLFIAKAREFEAESGDRERGMKQALGYCMDHGILKDFLGKHGSEVINMLITEWNWDTALEVSREDGKKEGIKEGKKEGMKEGKKEGIKEGKKEGVKEGKREIAKNALREGFSIEAVQKITGLDIETIRRLSDR
jgi:hypothetical protein